MKRYVVRKRNSAAMAPNDISMQETFLLPPVILFSDVNKEHVRKRESSSWEYTTASVTRYRTTEPYKGFPSMLVEKGQELQSGTQDMRQTKLIYCQGKWPRVRPYSNSTSKSMTIMKPGIWQQLKKQKSISINEKSLNNGKKVSLTSCYGSKTQYAFQQDAKNVIDIHTPLGHNAKFAR